MAVINSLSFKAQLLPFNTAISWQQEWERGRGKKDKFNVKKTRQCGASRFSGDLVASALWQYIPLSAEIHIVEKCRGNPPHPPPQCSTIKIFYYFGHFICYTLKVMDVPVPRLTTVPRPSPLLMMIVARILRPRRQCWIRVVRALKRWWLNIAIWSCSVLPLTGN